jgi:hypothetical protein
MSSLRDDYLLAVEGIRDKLLQRTKLSNLTFIGELEHGRIFKPKMVSPQRVGHARFVSFCKISLVTLWFLGPSSLLFTWNSGTRSEAWASGMAHGHSEVSLRHVLFDVQVSAYWTCSGDNLLQYWGTLMQNLYGCAG